MVVIIKMATMSDNMLIPLPTKSIYKLIFSTKIFFCNNAITLN